MLGRILRHEMELRQDHNYTFSTSVKKNLALKTTSSTSKTTSSSVYQVDDSEEELDEEMSSGQETKLNLLTRNFRKFYRQRKNLGSANRFKGKKQVRDKKCFECGEGHFVADCPNKKKDSSRYKKKKDFTKKKTFNSKHPTYSKNKATARAYVGQAWVSDDSGSEEESEEEAVVAGIAISVTDVPTCDTAPSTSDTAASHSSIFTVDADPSLFTAAPLCLMAKGSKVLTEDDFPDYVELMGILERTDRAYEKERKLNISLRDKLQDLRSSYDVTDDRENLRLDQENLEIAHDKLKLAHDLLLQEHEELKATHAKCLEDTHSHDSFLTSENAPSTSNTIETCLNCASQINALSSLVVISDDSNIASTSTATNSVDAAEHNKLKEELEELKRLMRRGLRTANIGMQNYQKIRTEMFRKNNGH